MIYLIIYLFMVLLFYCFIVYIFVIFYIFKSLCIHLYIFIYRFIDSLKTTISSQTFPNTFPNTFTNISFTSSAGLHRDDGCAHGAGPLRAPFRTHLHEHLFRTPLQQQLDYIYISTINQ